ncbi:flagellar hook-length control protein FliK [Rhizobium sp. AQ_MP]|uniref:flagellar hook-length control protein FliK n=1 Tax=Rhizobium sp. AQ_MP TaxID=2761536 RepID=UPI00163B0B30|nr:flagellar hook-length control protein FliK [Rhizobium sp. AQ_MP]MBC2771759.1 flagellar hook-length control protein FliK [Rhizobium sp. AQ_MP]
MMDALSAPRLPVSEGPATSPAASRGDKADEAGSFSKVLSKSGEREPGASRQERASEGIENGGAEKAPSSNSMTRTGEPPRQVIDDALLAELGALPDDLSTGDLMQALAKAQAKSKGASPESKEPLVEIEGLDPELRAQLAKAMMAKRERKDANEGGPAATDKVAEEGTPSEVLLETDVPLADLAGVLQLLASAQADVSEKTGEVAKSEKNGKEEQKVIAGLAMAAIGEDSSEASTSDEGQSDGDRDFRFIRADGKGQPLLLRGEETPGSEQAEPKPIETVTVVDSRRYIAPASTSNAASITAAMLGDAEWVTAMSPGSELANAAAHSSQGKVVHTLKLQMTPIELGSVTATLRLNGEELSVQLAVDNPAAYRQLSNDQSDILKALRAQGLVVDQVQVTMQLSPADRSADSGQSGSQNQQSGQQTGQQAFQSGNQSGSERQAQRGDASGNVVRTTDERMVQSAEIPSSGTRSARPDQLYV